MSPKTKFAVIAAVIVLAGIAGFASYKVRALSAELNDLAPKAARLDSHCNFMRIRLKSIMSLFSDPKTVEDATQDFQNTIVANDQNDVRLCLPQEKWKMVDPDNQALFCKFNKNIPCMSKITAQALDALK